MIVSDLFQESLRIRPHKEAIYCEPYQVRFSYAEMDERVNRLCNLLLEEGLQKGDRVCVMSPNCHMHPELIMAAAKGGWVLVEMDHRLSPVEGEYILNDSKPKILFAGKGMEDIIPAMNRALPKLKTIHFPDEYEKRIRDSPENNPELEVCENDIITLMYTSGTTGQPKGVIYTHKNLTAAVSNMSATLNVSSVDRALHTSPFSHIAPIWPFFLHVLHGGSNIIINDLDPIHILSTIEKEKITTWNTVPMLLARVLDAKDKEKFDISSLRCITYGASPIAVPVLKKAIRFFGKILNQIYGSTEVYLLTFLEAGNHVLKGSEEEVNRLTSCGLPITNTETTVVKADGNPVAPGEIGEVITHGDHVSPGYWGKPNETLKSMKEGWFHTGDLAGIDKNGFIFIKGRRKEIINTGGENVSPLEIENVLLMHESVKEAAVLGLPHEKWGEAVTAFVILKEGHTISDGELSGFCRGFLAGYKRPKAIVFLNDLPRTTSGKTMKRKLKDRYEKKFL